MGRSHSGGLPPLRSLTPISLTPSRVEEEEEEGLRLIEKGGFRDQERGRCVAFDE